MLEGGEDVVDPFTEAIEAGIPVILVGLDGAASLLPPDHPDRTLADLVALSATD